jgi:hypothetical protein
LKFEKANFERDNNCKRKRPILSHQEIVTVLPHMAREISVERITKLEDSLSGSNTLLIIEKSMVEFTKW